MAGNEGVVAPSAADITLTPRRPGAVDQFIGGRIEAERKAHHLTARELGRMLGFSAAQLYKYETGASRIPAATLVVIGQILDVPVTRFLPPAAAGVEPADPGLADLARALVEVARVVRAARLSPPPRSAPPRPRRRESRSPCR